MNEATPRIPILLVDDEPMNLDALEVVLDEPGYELLRAGNADAALKMLLDNDVAAIVLDIKMPVVSGLELAQMIKGTRRFRQIPIVFLTAYMVQDQDVLSGYDVGAVDYLTKPVNPKILRHKIAVFAELFRKTRALAELNDTLEERVRRRTADLEASETALRTANRQKDEFLAVLAHELRNPLAPLRLGVDILIQHNTTDAPPIISSTLARMDRQLDHIVRLIDDLLDISRISRGAIELKRERVDLATIVNGAIDSARPILDRHGHTISVDAPQAVYVNADPIRIAQILGNLLHNSAKFTGDGGSIRVELRTDGGDAVVHVIDSGEGIPADQLDRVFDLFARIDRPVSKAERGLGIGLALARRLAEMHGGGLSASSAGVGKGTTFTLRLPELEAPKPAAVPAVNLPGRDERGRPLAILVVEDNDDIADTLGAWLSELGHDVAIARTGSTGVEAVERHPPDLVLCDIGLPDIDGNEVCRRVRSLALVKQPIMVALTGWGRDDDRRRTKEAGFDDHLVKPVAADKLRSVLRNVAAAH